MPVSHVTATEANDPAVTLTDCGSAWQRPASRAGVREDAVMR